MDSDDDTLLISNLSSQQNSTVAATLADDPWFRVDLDSHYDPCCVGNGVLIINQTEQMVRVTQFLKSLGLVEKVPIVSAAIENDDA